MFANSSKVRYCHQRLTPHQWLNEEINITLTYYFYEYAPYIWYQRIPGINCKLQSSFNAWFLSLWLLLLWLPYRFTNKTFWLSRHDVWAETAFTLEASRQLAKVLMFLRVSCFQKAEQHQSLSPALSMPLLTSRLGFCSVSSGFNLSNPLWETRCFV